MHAEKVSHKILENACAWIHTARRKALQVNVLSAIESRRLSVTGLGRGIDSGAREKHCIKRANRLIGNAHLFAEQRDVYLCFARIVIATTQRPVILIDCSDLDPHRRHYLLRASVAADGQALTLYEEVHGLESKEKPTTHHAFIGRLKRLLPAKARPIVVTDAGFRTPWFRLIDAQGWDWVGRVRNRHLVRSHADEDWFRSNELYESATSAPKYLGNMQLTRNNPISCNFIIYKGKPKGRSKITCNGERARSYHSEQCAQREREPWLLVTSLPATTKLAKKVVQLYSTRMQIKEAFRDIKSVRFGIGFELNQSRSPERLQNLLLVAMIATFVLWLLGMMARLSQQHYQYQANTITNRQVLSLMYTGLRVANDRRFRFSASLLLTAVKQLHEMVDRHREAL